MKEIIERLITLLSGITPTEIEMLILLLWIKILYDIEKKSRVKNSWSNVKAALVFLSTTGSFILGLLWTGPKIARFPNMEHIFGSLTEGPALAICIPVALLFSMLNAAIVALIEMPFDVKEKKAYLKKSRREELEKI